MKEVERATQTRNMSLAQKVKREMIAKSGRKNVTGDQIIERVHSINKKNCTSSF
jgi:hypothetical protein